MLLEPFVYGAAKQVLSPPTYTFFTLTPIAPVACRTHRDLLKPFSFWTFINSSYVMSLHPQKNTKCMRCHTTSSSFTVTLNWCTRLVTFTNDVVTSGLFGLPEKRVWFCCGVPLSSPRSSNPCYRIASGLISCWLKPCVRLTWWYSDVSDQRRWDQKASACCFCFTTLETANLKTTRAK